MLLYMLMCFQKVTLSLTACSFKDLPPLLAFIKLNYNLFNGVLSACKGNIFSFSFPLLFSLRLFTFYRLAFFFLPAPKLSGTNDPRLNAAPAPCRNGWMQQSPKGGGKRGGVRSVAVINFGQCRVIKVFMQRNFTPKFIVWSFREKFSFE